MMQPNERVRKETLDGILMEGLSPVSDSSNQAVIVTPSIRTVYRCFCHACDMPRIERFDDGLSIHGMTDTRICFDF